MHLGSIAQENSVNTAVSAVNLKSFGVSGGSLTKVEFLPVFQTSLESLIPLALQSKGCRCTSKVLNLARVQSAGVPCSFQLFPRVSARLSKH